MWVIKTEFFDGLARAASCTWGARGGGAGRDAHALRRYAGAGVAQVGRRIGFMNGAAIALFDNQRGQHSPCNHIRERAYQAGIYLRRVDASRQRFQEGGEGFPAAGEVGDG